MGFDGIVDCGARALLKHDFIHAGFMKYALKANPKLYWELLEKVGVIGEKIKSDERLKTDPRLKAQVEGAFFMWTHELTTSIFVDGWPRSLPRQHWYLGGSYASRPQIFLRIAAKIGFIPPLFKNEIDVEAGMLQSLGLDMKGVDNPHISPHDKIKEVMNTLHPGYEYLADTFKDFYPHRHTVSVMATRFYNRIKSYLY